MNKRKIIYCLTVIMLFTTLILIMGQAAFAEQGLPWETPLAKLRDSLTGPVALIVSLVAVVAVGVTLIFGGDMQGFIRQACYIVLVVGIIISATNLVDALGFEKAGSVFILL